MTNPQLPRAQDPDNAPEIFAAGPTNCLVFGPMAMLTFTHIRHDGGDLFQGTEPAKTATIVRARIIMPTESWQNSGPYRQCSRKRGHATGGASTRPAFIKHLSAGRSAPMRASHFLW